MPGGYLYYEVTEKEVVTGTDEQMCEHGVIDVENG